MATMTDRYLMTWMGRKLENMSRDDLIVVIDTLARQHDEDRKLVAPALSVLLDEEEKRHGDDHFCGGCPGETCPICNGRIALAVLGRREEPDEPA